MEVIVRSGEDNATAAGELAVQSDYPVLIWMRVIQCEEGRQPRTVVLIDLPDMIAAIEIGTVADHLSYYAALNATRRDVVLKALSRARGNRAAAAKELGLNAKYLLQLIKNLRIG